MEGTWQKDDEIGAPILPVKTARLFVPANERVISIDIGYGTLKTLEGSFVIQHATTPYPLSHKGPFIADEPDPDIYERNAPHPSSVDRARSPQFLRGAQIVLVDLMPVLYNPVERQLKYYDQLEVRITTQKGKKPDWVRRFRNLPQDRKGILRTIENKNDFLNTYPASGQEETTGTTSAAEGSSPTAGDREYVIITTAGLMGEFQTLANHRASPAGGGYTTHIDNIDNIEANYAGVDRAEKMRNFIIDMYESHGTEYVVLGGDCDGAPGSHVIPTRGCYASTSGYTDSNIPSDLYFGCLEGSWNDDGDAYWGESNDGEYGGDIDWASEVFVGRIPADNPSEAANHISKIIAFETGNNPDQTLLVGEKLDNQPTWGGDRMEYVHSFMGSTPATRLYDKDGTWYKNDILNHINSNLNYWINHLGHSSVTYNMKMSNGDVYSMNNTKYLLVYSQGCYSGSIDSRYSSGSYGSTDCFGEAITNSYANRGAFAYIGNSRYGWYNPGSYVYGASNLAHKEFVEAIFHEDKTTIIGEANQKSKTDLPLYSGLYRWIAFETNLLGCPATDLAARACSSNSECDDGLFCNGAETCVAGVCQPGTPVDCGDGVGCTDDSCDEVSDSCVNTPNDSLCDDGLFCNGSEICDPGLDCLAGTSVNCDDYVDCTVDTCNEGSDECNNVPDDTRCDNGVFCDGVETCNALAGCQGGNEPCHDCDVINDICHACDNDGTCEDGEDCNNCSNDCISGGGGGYCGNGVCEPELGEDCLSCPGDCRGKQVGADKRQFCCGDGDGTNPVGCDDPLCSEDGFACTNAPLASYCCGDEVCEGAEDGFNCEIDCGPPPVCGDFTCDPSEDPCTCPGDCGLPKSGSEISCTDGIDDDCDGFTDCDDSDCDSDSACTCLAKWEPCIDNGECCSNWCHRGQCK
jgi:hypothetical protein